MVHAKTLDLVQWNQDPRQEKFVLFLKRQCKPIDNGSQDFQQLRDSIKPLSLIGELEENIVDRSADVWSQVQKFAINPMQGSLEEIAFPGIFGVEQFQQL